MNSSDFYVCCFYFDFHQTDKTQINNKLREIYKETSTERITTIANRESLNTKTIEQHQMGEVGTNSSDNPNADLKMNGSINGNRDDDDVEAMDVDAKDASVESITKNIDNSEVTTTTNDDAMETDTSAAPDDISNETNCENDINKDKTEAKTHENGASDTDKSSDQKQSGEATDADNSIGKNTTDCDSESNKVIDDEDNDLLVKISADPLATDEKPTSENEAENDERTNPSRSPSAEIETSATITSSNDNGE